MLVQPIRTMGSIKNMHNLNKTLLPLLLINGLGLAAPYALPRNFERGTCIIIGITAGIIIVNVIIGSTFKIKMLALLVSPMILTAMLDESAIYAQLAGYDHASLVIAIIGSVTQVISLLAAIVLATAPTTVLLLKGMNQAANTHFN